MAEAELENLCKEGRRHFRDGKYPQAIAAFERAVKLDPDRVDAHDGLGTATFILKQYDRAIEHFSRVTQLRPKEAKPLINLGAVYNRKGDYQKAAETLKKAVAKDSKAVEAYYNLGIAYRGLNQLALAVSSYKEAIKINPRMLDALQNLGNVLVEMGNPKAAIEQYKKALEINPHFERAQRGVTKAEEALSQAKAAVNPFGRLVNETALKQGKSDTKFRRLTSEERVNDRQVLRRVMIELNTAGEELLEHVRDDLDDSFAALQRGIQSSSQEVSRQLFPASDKFAASFKRFTELRSQVQRLAKQLQQHEASMQEKS